MGRRSIRGRILMSLAALVGFVVLAFVATVFVVERGRRADETEALVRSVERLLQQRLSTASATMTAVALALRESEAVTRALAQGDRAALAAATRPLFETLRRDHGVTHLYFIAPDHSVLLRAHEPELFGDGIERFTLRRAVATGASAAGVELGPLGTLTLRAVTPWRDASGGVLGYVELGAEVGPLLADLAASLGVELHALIERAAAERAGLGQGAGLAGRRAAPAEIGGYLLAAQAGEPSARARIALDAVMRDGASRVLHLDGAALAVAARPLLDASGARMGALAIVADVTAAHSAFVRTMIGASLLALLAGAAMFAFVHRALAGVDADYQRRHELELRLLRISSEHERLVRIEKLSAMGALVGEIAHQLNNPLVGVVNMTQLAERSIDRPERVRELLGEIRKAGQSCGAFVKRMLNFSKVSRYDARPCDLRAVVEEAVALFRQSTGRRTQVELRLPQAPARLAADANLLANALFNLLTNAAQAMEGGGRVTVSVAPENGEDGRAGWRLSVEDEGPGIPDEIKRKLFTPFFTTRKEGTGLGLAVVMHIALLHEGEASVSDRPQGGACFALWLPKGRPDLAGELAP